MLKGLLWIFLPGVVFGLLMLALPAPAPPPRWRAAARRRWQVLRDRWAQARGPRPPDPFEVLQLQLRLGVLAEQIRFLETDTTVWARGKRLQAAWAAYDALLRDACRLAGIEVTEAPIVPMGPSDETERFREEIELASRGWSW